MRTGERSGVPQDGCLESSKHSHMDMKISSPLTIERCGLMLILSSPSGAGKTSLARQLLEKDPHLSLSVSVTTRPQRIGEVEGKDYFFVSPETFMADVQADKFLEYANVFGYFYGTPRHIVETFLGKGQDVLFDVDWQGAQQLARWSAQHIVRVFILPPSLDELHHRLQKRSQDSEAIIKERMAKAQGEISHWMEYDYILINDDFNESLSSLQTILHAERLKRERQIGLSPFIQNLLTQKVI